MSGNGTPPGAHFVYMVECADGTYYTGYAVNVAERAAAHNSGRGAKYTRSRLPVTPVYAEAFATKSEALRREAAVKRLRRDEKQALIRGAGETAAGETSKISP